MARDIIRLSGFVPDREIEIVYTGVRPGEKLLEELIGDGEMPEVSPVPKIMMVRSNSSSNVASSDAIAHLEQCALDGRDEDVIEQLRRIIPSFAPLPRNRSVLRA
jgi:FlaA1/EpsC-like NDP-sugar epimerase